MENCLFCKIISGEIPSGKIYEDENCFAFEDISPKAPVHILLVPKIHVAGVHFISDENCGIAKNLFFAVSNIVKEQNLIQSGYRLVINSGEDGGQTVFHLHIHILGGIKMGWNPV
ncbi:MAG: histidine triad nucleotide-binding protein [Chitinispirillales bacterium]|jgi:histidine triad (HIT) family protein|nr:histidine triad nucleotide-binding protein [Chitinispirillales bacterium]